jgi:hypothetical protein
LLWLFWRWGLSNHLLRLASNLDLPDLSLPTLWDYRREPLLPASVKALLKSKAPASLALPSPGKRSLSPPPRRFSEVDAGSSQCASSHVAAESQAATARGHRRDGLSAVRYR